MKKTIEFEDAPSGQIMLYNYKEPFMEFYDKATGEGYGYEGVLVQTQEGTLSNATSVESGSRYYNGT